MLENALDPLKGINGYKGAAIADFTGEVLVSDSSNLSGDIEFTSATFNDIFRAAHKASKDLDLGATEIMDIHTENAVVLMGCSGEASRSHIHVFVIIAKDGNQALAKMAMRKVLPAIVDELT